MNSLLLEGLADAIGFIGGALLGYWLGLAFGLNIFDPGYTNASIGAILLVGLGGGIGLQLARRWRQSRKKDR
jgi:prepilin signal peptidase PulO-like enzyme (type II secretory pathway)